MKNTIRRTIAGLILAASMLFCVTGCGDKEATKPLKDITKAVWECGIDFPEMVEVNEDNFQFEYQIDADCYSEFSVYRSGDTNQGDEICIVKAKDGKKDDVKKAVEKRREAQINIYASYNSEASAQLEKSKVKTEGNYVYWICSKDNSKAEDKLLSYFE